MEKKSLIQMLLSSDKEDSNWEVMSSVSSRNTDRGYSRVMTRLLKQSNQLTMVLDGKVGRQYLFQYCCEVSYSAVVGVLIIQYIRAVKIKALIS